MKKYLIRILIIGFPIALIFLIGELALRNIPNDYSFKRAYLDENARNLKTLILGSSHSYRGINPQLLEQPAFNAAMVSQSLDYDLKILENYESELENLETLILPVSYSSLFNSLEFGIESWRTPYYNIYYGLGNSIKMEILHRKGMQSLDRVIDFYLLDKNLVKADSLGWGSRKLEVKMAELKNSGLEAAKRHTNKNFNLLPFQLENLNAIIQITKRNNWQLILVTLPAYESYVNNLNKNQLAQTIHYCEKLSRDFNHVFYYNFLMDKSFNFTNFYDADHLNIKGAELFTSKLVDTLKYIN